MGGWLEETAERFALWFLPFNIYYLVNELWEDEIAWACRANLKDVHRSLSRKLEGRPKSRYNFYIKRVSHFPFCALQFNNTNTTVRNCWLEL